MWKRDKDRAPDTGSVLEVSLGGWRAAVALAVAVLLVTGIVILKRAPRPDEIARLQAMHQIDQQAKAASHERFLQTVTILVTSGGVVVVLAVAVGLGLTVFRDRRQAAPTRIYLIVPPDAGRQWFQSLPERMQELPANSVIVDVIKNKGGPL